MYLLFRISISQSPPHFQNCFSVRKFLHSSATKCGTISNETIKSGAFSHKTAFSCSASNNYNGQSIICSTLLITILCSPRKVNIKSRFFAFTAKTRTTFLPDDRLEKHYGGEGQGRQGHWEIKFGQKTCELFCKVVSMGTTQLHSNNVVQIRIWQLQPAPTQMCLNVPRFCDTNKYLDKLPSTLEKCHSKKGVKKANSDFHWKSIKCR